VARLRSLPSTPPGTAVIVSTAISISEHITFPNDIAVSVTLTDGYTHRTATYSNLFSKYWHLCPDKYGGRAAATNKRAFMILSRSSDSARITTFANVPGVERRPLSLFAANPPFLLL
jgi:hypothetical protein